MNMPRMNFLRSPVLRMSLAMSMLACGLVLLSDLIGLFPDTRETLMQARKSVAETLAVQSVAAIEVGSESTVQTMFDVIQGRERGLRSIALRRNDGTIVAMAGDHGRHWTLTADSVSTETHVRVPIHQRAGPWGSLEIVFDPLAASPGPAGLPPSMYAVLGFLGFTSVLAFVTFLRRALSELDPNAVIPQRVRNAFDALSEGLVILDTDERIMLVNTVFAGRLDQSAESLVGRKLSSLDWLPVKDNGGATIYPWTMVLTGLEQDEPFQVCIETPGKQVRKLAVTAVAVTAPDGSVRGAMVSFSDLTDVERANSELKRTLQQLETMQRDLARQNQELLVLATRDSLTGVLNRRALFEAFDNLLTESQREGRELCCVMIDIDKFKSINDRYGHGVGDQVIKAVAQVLSGSARATDLVGRYGGEEFCVLLPDTSMAQARDIAERIRLAIQNGSTKRQSLPMQITASLGISSTAAGATAALDLCNQADRALYMAKESGRNKVVTVLELADTSPRPARAPGPAAVPAAVSAPADQGSTDAALRARIGELERALIDSERARAGSLQFSVDPAFTSWALLHSRLESALRSAQRNHTQGGVITMAIGNLGEILAGMGQDYAVRLLDSIGKRISALLRGTDSIAMLNPGEPGSILVRQGIDELVIIIPDLKDPVDASRIVHRIETAMTEPFDLEGMEIFPVPRFGVAIYPTDGEEATTLLSHANAALRMAGQRGKGSTCRFYSDDLNRQAHEQLRLESELRHAVERGELLLHYQPRVNLRTGRISGVEALIRWQHPRLGLVYPDRFIPLAERTGLISEIGAWVIEAVCRQLRQWTREGLESLEMAINVSPLQLDDESFPHLLTSRVRAEGIDPSLIELEITESVVIANISRVVTILGELHDAGFNTALDDFGTGYASLSYLRNLPVNRIKIDRSFLAGVDSNPVDYSIVSSLIDLGHALEKRVVAEGVETEEQWLALRELGCDEAQGYFLSRPCEAGSIRELLTHGSPLRSRLRLVESDERGRRPAHARTAIRGVLNESGR